MKLHVYTWMNKKAGFSTHPSCSKDDPKIIEESYRRSIATDQSKLPSELKDCALFELGTYDDVAMSFDLYDHPVECFNVANLILDLQEPADKE